jgi:outer membrane immunogenic protein
MKKFIAAIAVSAAFAGSAVGADLPASTYTKAPLPPAPVYNWTGFWISGGFGYGMFDNNHSVTSATAPFALFDPSHDTSGRGWLGKVGGGGDYQFAGPFGTWVVGAFADAQWTDIKGQSSFFCPTGCAGTSQFSGEHKNDWSWAVGGRIGYVALPGLLTYVNGGYTQAHFSQVNYRDADPSSATFGAFSGVILPSRTKSGWFLGGGTEYAITQIPGLFWKTEYRFSDFGDKTNSQVCVLAITATPGCAAGAIHSLDHNHIYEQTATTELVYRFNWGGPLVAKY